MDVLIFEKDNYFKIIELSIISYLDGVACIEVDLTTDMKIFELKIRYSLIFGFNFIPSIQEII